MNYGLNVSHCGRELFIVAETISRKLMSVDNGMYDSIAQGRDWESSVRSCQDATFAFGKLTIVFKYHSKVAHQDRQEAEWLEQQGWQVDTNHEQLVAT